jgi:hypothetical protein
VKCRFSDAKQKNFRKIYSERGFARSIRAKDLFILDGNAHKTQANLEFMGGLKTKLEKTDP